MAWTRAQTLRAEPSTALALARTKRLLGRAAEARAALEGTDPAGLPAPLQAERWDGRGRPSHAREYDQAIAALETANRIAPTGERHFLIGLNQADLNRTDAAIESFEEAVARTPENTRYAAALGYAYRRAGRAAEAAAFSRAWSRPTRTSSGSTRTSATCA